MLLMLGVGLHFSTDDLMSVRRILLKALESQGIIDSSDGRIAVGWLVVEDLAMVLVLALAPLPAFAPMLGGTAPAGPGRAVWLTMLITLAHVGGFVAFMLIVGRRPFPWLLWHVAKTGSRELFTLCVVAAAVNIAYGSSHLFGVSFALGAFLAGMVLRESEFSHRAAEQTLPLQDAFALQVSASLAQIGEFSFILAGLGMTLGLLPKDRA